MTFSDILFKSSSENLKQLTKVTKMNHFSILFFTFFMKIIGFCTVFIADMNSACKNSLISVGLFLLNLQIRQNFRQLYQRLQLCDSADFLKNLKYPNFALFVFFPYKKHIL